MSLRRAFALCLALVLSWSSLSTQESWLDVVAGAETVCLADIAASGPAAAPGTTPGGSVGDHHLDDQPGQPAGDTGADQSALPSSGVPARAVERASLRPPGTPAKRYAPPALDGPRRPPRAAGLLA